MKKLLLPLLLLISACGQPEKPPPILERFGEVNIVPKPVSIERLGGAFELTKETVLIAGDETANKAATAFNDMMAETYGMEQPLPIVDASAKPKDSITFATVPDAGESENYKLRVGPHSVQITGGERGMYYAVQSLFKMLPLERAEVMIIPAAEINDGPRFRYRGANLDTARHFMPVEFVKKYIRQLSQYKMNYFHWHLTDDQGWRIEIKKYPKLTEVGSKRRETVAEKNYRPYRGDGKPVEGFYTQDEIQDIVAYAKARYVRVIPEIEMPAHASAALAAYPEYGCKPGYPYKVQTTWGGFPDVFCPTPHTLDFLKDVLGEVMDLFPDADYIHIGADETDLSHWAGSAAVRALKQEQGLADDRQALRWFVNEIGSFVSSRGKKIICWDDVLDSGSTVNATIMAWNGYPAGADAARSGHEVIMTPADFTYFDHPQGKNEPLSLGPEVSLRDVYNFNPIPAGISAADSRNIIGGQACLWTEFIKTPEHAEYMAFPRMLALAEVLWSKPAASGFADRQQNARDYEDFTKRLYHEFPRMDRANVNYRVPEPYGLIDKELAPGEKAVVDLSSPVPGGKVYYTLDGTLPSRFSKEFLAPFVLAADAFPPYAGSTIEIKVIVFSANGVPSPVRSCKYTRK